MSLLVSLAYRCPWKFHSSRIKLATDVSQVVFAQWMTYIVKKKYSVLDNIGKHLYCFSDKEPFQIMMKSFNG